MKHVVLLFLSAVAANIYYYYRYHLNIFFHFSEKLTLQTKTKNHSIVLFKRANFTFTCYQNDIYEPQVSSMQDIPQGTFIPSLVLIGLVVSEKIFDG